MGNPTVCSGYPKALLEFAVSRGADRQSLIAKSHIHPDELLNQDNRIPVADYVAMLKAGSELCNEPALSLLFGEAVTLPGISIVGLMAGFGKSRKERRPRGQEGTLRCGVGGGFPPGSRGTC